MNGTNNIWKLLKEHGDIGAIHEETGMSRTTINTAFDDGIGGEEVVARINAFYLKKVRNRIKFANKNHVEEIKELKSFEEKLS